MDIEDNAGEPGIARRPASFSATADKAAAFLGTTYTTVEIMRLISRMGAVVYHCDDGAERRLSPGGKNLLLLLVSYTDSTQWESGEPYAWPSNTTLSDELGVSVRQTQYWLYELEAAGLIARRYDLGNERLAGAGIDLRPLGGQLRQIAEAIQGRCDARAQRRQSYRSEAKDSSRGGETSCTLPYKTKGFSAKNLTTPSVENPETVDKAERGTPRRSTWNGRSASKQPPLRGDGLQGSGGAKFVPLERLADDARLLELMVHASPRFKQRLSAATHPFDYHAANIADVVGIIQALRLTDLAEFNERQWISSVQRHGARAVLAVLLALETPGILNRAAYLAGILKKSTDDPTFNPEEGLRRLVRH